MYLLLLVAMFVSLNLHNLFQIFKYYESYKNEHKLNIFQTKTMFKNKRFKSFL